MNEIDILGGGPAGLASAFYAKEKNISFRLYESQKKIGGNCKTLTFDGCNFDTGAHRFHDKERTATNTIKGLLKDDLILVNAPSRILWNEKMINFPLEPMNIIQSLSKKDIIKIIMENFVNLFSKSSVEENFQKFAYKKYGKTLSNYFLNNYTEKLWGVSAQELHPRVSGSRLSNLNIFSILKGLIIKKKTKHYEGAFWYPRKGYGQIFEAISKNLRDSISCSSSIEKIYHDNKSIENISFSNGKNIEVQTVISTLPINFLINNLEPKPPNEIVELVESLKFRNLRLAIFTLNTERFSKNASMYFPQKNIPFTRIYEPKNRSIQMAPANKTCIVVEVPCSPHDHYDVLSDEEFLLKIKDILIKNSLIKKSLFNKSKSLRMLNAYPILTIESQSNLERINKYLDCFVNLISIGRNAQFEYLHTHHLFKTAHDKISSFSTSKK